MTKTTSGYATTYMVVVLGALLLGLVFSASQSALSSAKFSNFTLDAQSQRYLLDACVEIALLDLYTNQLTPQSGTYQNFADEKCRYTISKSGSDYQIIAELIPEPQAVSNQVTITVKASDYLRITAWR